jgi:hypothetical protein
MSTLGACLGSAAPVLVVIGTFLTASKNTQVSGIVPTDARSLPVFNKSKLLNVTNPNMMRVELIESFPGPLVRQAIESWKH